MSIITDAVNFAYSIYKDDKFPEELVELGKRALIDYVGLVLAGSKEPVSCNVLKYIEWISARTDSNIFGSSLKTTSNLAALANGVAGHALDYDDTSFTIIGHPTVAVAPAVFAMGEVMHSTGKDVIKAFVLGIEIENKIASLVMPKVSDNGWHTTSVFGPFGAAAASALLTKLDSKQFVSALGLAASKSSGIRSNFGTMAKPFHAGMAAYNGATAALLAGFGLTASDAAIEGKDGFIQCFSGKTKDRNNYALSFGKPWDIIEPGLAFKQYPSCSGTHPALDCIFAMLKENGFEADEVESINVGVSLLGPRELVCHFPKTPMEARFSMEYALAAAIVYGKFTLTEFTEEKINNQQIQSLMRKIKMEVDIELVQLGFIGTAPAKIIVLLKDGRIIKGRCDLAKGNPQNPLSDDEFRSKFLECASRVFEPRRCNEILSALLSLEKVDNINTITDLLKK